MPHDGHVLAGQIGEAVYVKCMIFRKITAFQLLQKPVHLISGVRLTLGAERIVALLDQGQLFELLGQGAGGLLRSLPQILGCDAAAFEFVHRIQQVRQKFRPGLHGSIGLEAA